MSERRRTPRAFLAAGVLAAGTLGGLAVLAATPSPAAAGGWCYEQSAATSTQVNQFDRNCSLFAGWGANFTYNSAPALGTAAATADIVAAEGKTVTLGASWEDSSNSYSYPGQCSNMNFGGPGWYLSGSTTILVCGYWVIGEEGVPNTNSPLPILVFNDLPDWVNNPWDRGWTQPQPSGSIADQCDRYQATCTSPWLMMDANGDLVNGATVNGSSTIVWSDVWGSYYFGGSTQWNSSSGSFASWFNSSWAEQYWDGNYCSGCNPTVVFQLDANLVVYGPGPPAAAPGPVHLSTSSTAYWATLSHSFPIPLTGGADGTSPGYYEQIAWLYATAQPGADPDGDGDSVLGDTDGSDDSTVWACALNAGAYPAIEPNGTAPPGGCQAQVCPPVQQSVYCNLSVQVPAAGGAFFAEPVLLEWYAAGSQSGFGAQWTFHLATGPSEYIAEMPSLALSAGTGSATTGQGVPFTFSYDPGGGYGYGINPGDTLELTVVSASPGSYAGTAPSSMTCTAGSGKTGSCTVWGTDTTAQTVTYQVVDTATGFMSNTVTVTWWPPGSLSLSAAPSSLTTGQATSFTVSASFGTQVRSGDQVAINVVSTSPGPYAGSTPASCSLPSAGSCTSSATDGSAQTVTYQAVDTATGATSNTVTVTWSSPPVYPT